MSGDRRPGFHPGAGPDPGATGLRPDGGQLPRRCAGATDGAPQFGWVDFDPTNDLMPSDEYITLAWGRDYGDVSPTTGFIRGGGNQVLEVEVRVMQAK